MNIDARADHIASTLKRCYSIALGILKIVNILKDLTNASPQNTKYFNYPLFQVINLLSAKQISTVPNLQRQDVDVQTTLQRCVMALNAPMKLAHLMF